MSYGVCFPLSGFTFSWAFGISLALKLFILLLSLSLSLSLTLCVCLSLSSAHLKNPNQCKEKRDLQMGREKGYSKKKDKFQVAGKFNFLQVSIILSIFRKFFVLD